jgi:hypothetical protein
MVVSPPPAAIVVASPRVDWPCLRVLELLDYERLPELISVPPRDTKLWHHCVAWRLVSLCASLDLNQFYRCIPMPSDEKATMADGPDNLALYQDTLVSALTSRDRHFRLGPLCRAVNRLAVMRFLRLYDSPEARVGRTHTVKIQTAIERHFNKILVI